MTVARWRLWCLASGLPGVCKASAYDLLISGRRRSPLTDDVCRDDLAANGACWCGKLRQPARPSRQARADASRPAERDASRPAVRR
jgi:hypothetical protein